jgi:hypothetical protein
MLVLCALLGGGSAWAQNQVPPQAPRGGILKTVQGDVVLVHGDTRRPARAGDSINATDRIVTSGNSATAVTLRDGTALVVGPNSSVGLTRFEYEPSTQKGNLLVDVLQGSIRMVSGLIGKLNPEQVKVKTPTVVVGVRGTDFIVDVP